VDRLSNVLSSGKFWCSYNSDSVLQTVCSSDCAFFRLCVLKKEKFMPLLNSGQPNPTLLTPIVAAQTGPVTNELIKLDQQISAFLAALKADPILQKIGSALAALAQPNTVPDLFRGNSLLQIFGGYVVVEAAASSDVAALKTDLERLGLVRGTSFGNQVSGLLPIGAITQAAQLQSLSFVRPVYKPITNVGRTTSQAVPSMRADIARSTYNVDGTGITIGVLSDSYNNLGGAANDVASRDLPGIGNPNNSNPVQVLSDLSRGGSDEGRAMLQLIHDVAPGARLSFHTAFLGQADFAQGILDLANAGANVIVDDIIYFAEPMFQDGIIAQAVDQVVARGIPYFSSAGNDGRRSYEAAFRNSGQTQAGIGEFHDFDPGAGVDTRQSITVPVGREVLLSFQWSSPFRSVSGGSGAQTDLDIYLVNNAGNVLASSTDSNIGGDPVEILDFQNNGSFGTTQFNLVIARRSGPVPARIKYVSFGSETVNEFNTNSGTVFGHANAAGAAAVGAAYYRDTPAFGTTPPRIESFSSAGPTEILFTTTGAPTSQIRNRPNIVAPDGTNTTFFGQDSDGDGFPNFFGTSAAAPHAAAVAALMLNAAPGTSPSAIYQALQSTAIDMDDPATAGFDTGYDFGTGFGLIQADAALRALVGTPNPVVPTVNGKPATIYVNAANRIVGGPNNGQNYSGTLNGTAGNDVIFATEGNDTINGSGGSDTINARGGTNSITVTQGDSYIEAGSGNDTISLGSGSDEVRAGDGANFIYTNASSADGTNRITSGSGNDNISMRTGNNIINSGGGNDNIGVGVGRDTIDAGAGNDYIYSIGILTTIAGDVNTIDAGEGVNTIAVYGGTNDVVAGSGNDNITLGNGSDRINAGTGTNTVTGGAGADQFVLVQGTGVTTIQDFRASENDRLTGFSFSQVVIAQGTGFDFNNTLITARVGGDLLAKLTGVRASTITANSFV
jgi:Ca2+-binding RTX toxin-like protein